FYPVLKLQPTATLYEDLLSLQKSRKERPKYLSILRQKAKVKSVARAVPYFYDREKQPNGNSKPFFRLLESLG
ncbi:MAG TPA: hypothetical protein VF350_02325, partial [Candidatus Bathyarchaeia archaeon]